MCATEVHEVRSCPACSSWADCGPVELALPAWLCALTWLTELVEPDRAPAPAPRAAALEAAGTATIPASPAQATRKTPAPPAAAASRDAPSPASRRVRTRRQARSMAPWRTGSSTYFQDSAARAILAAICQTALGRSSVLFAGDVSTMT